MDLKDILTKFYKSLQSSTNFCKLLYAPAIFESFCKLMNAFAISCKHLQILGSSGPPLVLYKFCVVFQNERWVLFHLLNKENQTPIV